MDLRLLGERLPSELFRLIERILPEFSVFDLRSGLKKFPDGPCDRFRVSWSICNVKVIFTVIFHDPRGEAPPDILPPPPLEEHCEAYLPLLGGWVRADPDRLLHLVRGLQKATQRIEAQRVLEVPDARLQTEIQALAALLDGFPGASMDMLAVETDRDREPAMPRAHTRVRVRLHLKFPIGDPDHPAEPAVGVAKLRLGVEIRGDEWVTEYMLRGPPSLAIEPPVWEAEMTMCEYFIHAHNAALDALDAFVLRRQYVAAMLVEFGSFIAEYDDVGYRMVSFVTGEAGSVLVTVELDNDFPDTRPEVILTSLHPFEAGQGLFQWIVPSYPYSPRWDAGEHARRLRTYLVEDGIPDFADALRRKDQMKQ